MEAKKLKDKLHGSILKGSKMKVEQARPNKKQRLTDDVDEKEAEAEADRKAKRAAKKQKREEGVLPGFALPEERKVRRGWTEPVATMKVKKPEKKSEGKAGKKSKISKIQTSSFSNDSECLFRTRLPPNAAFTEHSSAAKEKKPKRRKEAPSEREIIVHEFKNTTKQPSFLRDNQGFNGQKSVSEYVDGKGWLNEDGELVEPPRSSERISRRARTVKADEADPSTENTKLNSKIFAKEIKPAPDAKVVNADDTSTSGSSSSSEDEQDEGSAIGVLKADSSSGAVNVLTDTSTRSRYDDQKDDAADGSAGTSSSGSSSSSSGSGSEANVPALTSSSTKTPTEIHPLEALFKRPKSSASETPRKPQLEVKTTFSFFGPDDNTTDATQRLMPQTPFTQKDLHFRSLRSAAPTPDTAAPNKLGFGNLWGRDEDAESNEDEDLNGDEMATKNKELSFEKSSSTELNSEGKPPESDFAKWFWEHRGETNRAWKKRLREAKKGQRQKENKKTRRSVI